MTAIGLDHIGIAAHDLDAVSAAFAAAGFHVTPPETHASGRTANRCVMLRDGGYLELIAIVPGQASATLDGFLARGPGAHILALEVADEAATLDRLHRAGFQASISVTERPAGGGTARFSLIMPPDTAAGRLLLIRHHTRDLLWRAEHLTHPNGALGLVEAVFSSAAPAETIAHLSRASGCAASPDPMGGYRVELARGRVRVLPPQAVAALFPGTAARAPIAGLTLTCAGEGGRVVRAGGVAIRFVAG